MLSQVLVYLILYIVPSSFCGGGRGPPIKKDGHAGWHAVLYTVRDSNPILVFSRVPYTLGQRCTSILSQLGRLTGLNIQIAHKLRVLFNKESARLHVISHQPLEGIVRENRVLDRHLKDRPRLGIHGGVP